MPPRSNRAPSIRSRARSSRMPRARWTVPPAARCHSLVPGLGAEGGRRRAPGGRRQRAAARRRGVRCRRCRGLRSARASGAARSCSSPSTAALGRDRASPIDPRETAREAIELAARTGRAPGRDADRRPRATGARRWPTRLASTSTMRGCCPEQKHALVRDAARAGTAR